MDLKKLSDENKLDLCKKYYIGMYKKIAWKIEILYIPSKYAGPGWLNDLGSWIT
jgi:hypothetical protein